MFIYIKITLINSHLAFTCFNFWFFKFFSNNSNEIRFMKIKLMGLFET